MTFGFSAAFIAIPGQTVLQENSTDAIRGRVLAMYFMVSNAASFFPIVIAGSAADRVGILETIGLMGGLILAIGLVSHWSYRRHPAMWGLRGSPAGTVISR
jgi:dipeptide/tripeptide permease